MSKILEVLNKKVELKSEVVEFATVAELEGAGKSLNALVQKFPKLALDIDKAKGKLFSLTNEIEKQIKEAKSKRAETTKQVKALGLSSKDIPAIQELNRDLDFAEDNLKRAKDRL